MEKINFPLEKTIFLPRGKAPIGKMEKVTAKAEVQAIEPAQTGWLCYGKLIIDLEYLPIGAGKSKSQEQWKNISQQLLSIGTEEKEQCLIEADFIQELPERDYVFGSDFIADVNKKTWQQIASNALEISVEIALTVKEKVRQQQKKKEGLHYDHDQTDRDFYIQDFVLEQDDFVIEDCETKLDQEPPVTKKEVKPELDDLYYYADEEGCDHHDLIFDHDTVIFVPETEKKKEETPICREDLHQKEICPLEEGANSKGQHLCNLAEKDKKVMPSKPSVPDKNECPTEFSMAEEITLEEPCPVEEKKITKPAKAKQEEKEEMQLACEKMAREEIAQKETKILTDCVIEKEEQALPLNCICEKEIGEEKNVKEPVKTVRPQEEKEWKEPICHEEDAFVCPNETTDKEDFLQEGEEDGCQIVPLPISPKEKLTFWKGKKGKKDMDDPETEEQRSFGYPPQGVVVPPIKQKEPRKGYRLKFYVVQGGEDLAAIAEKHSVSPSSILAANKNITEEDIRTGMVLSIPM